MQITKYGHACLFLEKEGQRLVIDPGGLTELPEDLSGILAVIVTHPHADHLSIPNLERIILESPGVKIYGVSETIDLCEKLVTEKLVISSDQSIIIGGFNVSLYHTDHAVIHQVSPCENLAIKVNEELYYPGDSLHLINERVKVVAVPISAPWVKATEYINFAQSIDADIAIPTHNGLLNNAGHTVMNNWLEKGLENSTTEFKFLENGEYI